MKHTLHAVVLFLSPVLVAGLTRGQKAGACKDATGIRWVLPFEQALDQAKQAKRLLMVKPIAFGTTADGGW